MTPSVLSLFEAAEAGPKGYNAYNRGTRTDPQGIRNILPGTRDIDFAALSLDEVMALQKLPRSNPDSVFAVGLYQLTPDTTRHAQAALGLQGQEKFTPSLQDRIFSEYLLTQKRPGIEAYIKNEGKNSLKSAQHELSKEWAGMPDPYKHGASHYGTGTANRAHVDLDATKALLEGWRADYAQLRSEGLNKRAAWAGLFDGRVIERRPEPQVAAGPAELPNPSRPRGAGAADDDETSVLDDLRQMPVFKSMQAALGTMAGPGLAKKLDGMLSVLDERKLFSAMEKVVHEVAGAPKDALRALNERYKSTMATHVPIQIVPEALASPVYPVPVKRVSPDAHSAPPAVDASAVAGRPNVCAASDEILQRLLHQVQAHLAGEAGRHLKLASESDGYRFAHAVAAEARISGFQHVAELQVTRDAEGVVAFDGTPDSPASRRIYVDRVQAISQPVEQSAALAKEVAIALENRFTESLKPSQLVQR